MAGLVPKPDVSGLGPLKTQLVKDELLRIHVFLAEMPAWMPATSAGMTALFVEAVAHHSTPTNCSPLLHPDGKSSPSSPFRYDVFLLFRRHLSVPAA
jgi:hypothetical protein